MKKNKSPKSSDESSSITALRLENERLRAELKDAKMRAHAFDTMIDVAEEMFNLPIRKKLVPNNKRLCKGRHAYTVVSLANCLV